MLSVRNLTKTFAAGDGTVGAVRDISFEAETGAFFTLLGPSGCGKTTTLRCIAGLERPDAGDITLNGQLVDAPARGIHVPPFERPIGMVFQSYAIWPHMTVFQNVAYPLEVARDRPSGAELTARVMDALSLVKMSHLATRPAPQLSGGQQQRIALARALVSRPRLLLLDEPLSNLDAKLRTEMRLELGALVASLGITTVFVTHDQDEALAMSSHIAVMNGGAIVQEGTPADIYRRPADSFVAGFVGAANLFDGVLIAIDRGTCRVRLADGVDVVTGPADAPWDPAPGSPVTIALRPEDVIVTDRETESRQNTFAATIEWVTFLGGVIEGRAVSALGTVRFRISSQSQLDRGARVSLTFRPETCRCLRSRPASTQDVHPQDLN